MDDRRLGAAFRAIRLRRGLRQIDVAAAAGVSRAAVGRLENGKLAELRAGGVRAIAGALDARIDLLPRWQGGDLGRVVNERHAAMHETAAALLAARPGWTTEPEVSLSIYGERGVIDILAWHAESRMLLVIELKTEIVDVNDLMGSVDRKRRLATVVARERGWDATSVSAWVLVAEGTTNRRHVARHRTVLRAKFPDNGRAVAAAMARPGAAFSGLSFLPSAPTGAQPLGLATVKRVRPRRPRDAARHPRTPRTVPAA